MVDKYSTFERQGLNSKVFGLLYNDFLLGKIKGLWMN